MNAYMVRVVPCYNTQLISMNCIMTFDVHNHNSYFTIVNCIINSYLDVLYMFK